METVGESPHYRLQKQDNGTQSGIFSCAWHLSIASVYQFFANAWLSSCRCWYVVCTLSQPHLCMLSWPLWMPLVSWKEQNPKLTTRLHTYTLLPHWILSRNSQNKKIIARPRVSSTTLSFTRYCVWCCGFLYLIIFVGKSQEVQQGGGSLPPLLWATWGLGCFGS